MSKELESRMVEFSSLIISLKEVLKGGYASSQLARQIIRSGLSCALNYGEAQNAQSRRDFIHKISIVIKELRETSINLQIIRKSALSKDEELLSDIMQENDELLAIFTKSLLTAKKNAEI